MLPWKFRPENEASGFDNPNDEEPEWEDNWLSNSLAWFSQVLMPSWCSDENHWTVKVLDYLWAECPCCLLFRGITIGLIIGLLIGGIFAAFF